MFESLLENQMIPNNIDISCSDYFIVYIIHKKYKLIFSWNALCTSQVSDQQPIGPHNAHLLYMHIVHTYHKGRLSSIAGLEL